MIFIRKCAKVGTQMEGDKDPIHPKTYLFLIGLPLGSPGEPKVTKMESTDAKMTSGEPTIEVLGSETAPKMCATIGTATTILVASF